MVSETLSMLSSYDLNEVSWSVMTAYLETNKIIKQLSFRQVEVEEKRLK